MEINTFVSSLESALIRRGISEDRAVRQVASLRNSFTREDFEEIEAFQTPDEIENLADNLASIMQKSPSPKPATVESAAPLKPEDVSPANDKSADEYAALDDEEVQIATTKGMTIFWVGLLLTLPITLALLAIPVAFFAALFGVLIGLIIVGIAAMVALAGAGALLALVAIIYGITQLFSFTTAGIYEISLGVIVIGLALAAAVLFYNFSVRFVPWLIRKTAVFCRFVFGKLKTLFLAVRKECYQL